jgi:hypothetical protein
VKAHRAGLLAVVAVVVAALAAPGGSSGQGSPDSSVTGAIKVTFQNFPAPGLSTTEHIAISAHDGPNGPRGSIVFQSPLAAIPVATVTVTCLVVSGNEAWVGGTFKEPFAYTVSLGSPPARIVHFGVQLLDHGPPGSRTPDEVHPVVFDDRPRPPTFSPCNFDLPLFPVDQGNLGVRDRGVS